MGDQHLRPGRRSSTAYRAAYNEWGLWIILIKGLTPIPYKLVTIASGAAAFNLCRVHRRLDRHARRALLHGRGPATVR